MESRQLRYFLAVAECGSFTAAAARIGVAQPALSTQVAKLEGALGCRLFERHARGATLTRAGEHLREEALAIVDHLDRAACETRLIGGTRKQECTIGLPPYAANVLAVPLIAAVAAALPAVELHILDAMGGTLREWFADGRLDLAVVYRVPNEPLEDTTSLISEELHVAIHNDAEIRIGTSVTANELFAIPLIVSTPRNAHRQLLDDVARRKGLLLKVAAEIDSVSGQRKLVLMGAGAAVLPLGDFADWPLERLDLVPVTDPELTASLLVVRGRHVRHNPVVQSIERVVVDLITRLVADGSWRGARMARQVTHANPAAVGFSQFDVAKA
jgi:LysR family nitrogen assimilation transcriptional regulator